MSKFGIHEKRIRLLYEIKGQRLRWLGNVDRMVKIISALNGFYAVPSVEAEEDEAFETFCSMVLGVQFHTIVGIFDLLRMSEFESKSHNSFNSY